MQVNAMLTLSRQTTSSVRPKGVILCYGEISFKCGLPKISMDITEMVELNEWVVRRGVL